MSLYTPTVWVENETPRSAALFNKREQGIANLFKKRAYWNSGSGYSVTGNNTYYDLKFGTAATRKFYDTDNTAVGSCITQSSGHDISILKPSWATFGIVSATIIPSDWDFLEFYAAIIFNSGAIYGRASSTQKKIIKMQGIATTNVSISVAAQENYDEPVGYGATVSVFWY